MNDTERESRNGNFGPSSDARVGERLYNRIAVLRAERGMSRQELADSIGVNYQTLGYLERGDYNPKSSSHSAGRSSSSYRSRQSFHGSPFGR